MSNMSKRLDTFTWSFLETALWATTGEDQEPLDSHLTIEGLSDNTLHQAISDCDKFRGFLGSSILNELDDKQAGHDFFLTRERHGTGFWDGDYPEPAATILTALSHHFGDFDFAERGS